MFYYSPFDSMFRIVPVLVGAGFIVVFGMILFAVIRGATEWNQNNHSPILTVAAVIATKRTNVSHHSSANQQTGGMSQSCSTTYYVTFQVESGDRMEFQVKNEEYGLLVEGDVGKLTFQGTRYIGFERKYSNI